MPNLTTTVPSVVVKAILSLPTVLVVERMTPMWIFLILTPRKSVVKVLIEFRMLVPTTIPILPSLLLPKSENKPLKAMWPRAECRLTRVCPVCLLFVRCVAPLLLKMIKRLLVRGVVPKFATLIGTVGLVAPICSFRLPATMWI